MADVISTANMFISCHWSEQFTIQNRTQYANTNESYAKNVNPFEKEEKKQEFMMESKFQQTAA